MCHFCFTVTHSYHLANVVICFFQSVGSHPGRFSKIVLSLLFWPLSPLNWSAPICHFPPGLSTTACRIAEGYLLMPWACFSPCPSISGFSDFQVFPGVCLPVHSFMAQFSAHHMNALLVSIWQTSTLFKILYFCEVYFPSRQVFPVQFRLASTS